MERVGLAQRAQDRAGSLPYGDQRRLGVIRALATDPAFLLLDEPAAGLNEAEADALVTAIRELRDDFGCGVLLIEHDMRVVMGLCERIHVLDYGRTISDRNAGRGPRGSARDRGIPRAAQRERRCSRVEDLERELRADRRPFGGISFEVAEGELVSVVGPNGAGKSTTLAALAGLRPIAGRGRSLRGAS